MSHLYATDPDQPKRRPKLTPCRHCGANGAACDSLHWLRARTCCEKCDGTHDGETP